MARRKRTDFQREADLPKIAKMYRDGVYQVEIAAKFGLSQGQISQDIAEVVRRWRADSIEYVTDKKQAELDRINNLEITYWQAWERSREDAMTATVETKSIVLDIKDDSGTDYNLPAKEVKETKRRSGQAGDPSFLAGVMSCIKRRCELLGLDAPTKQELTGRDGGPLVVMDI